MFFLKRCNLLKVRVSVKKKDLQEKDSLSPKQSEQSCKRADFMLQKRGNYWNFNLLTLLIRAWGWIYEDNDSGC
jgi:hypothetical protein